MAHADHELRVGLRHEASIRVTPDLTVPGLAAAFPGFGDMPPVFATASMIGFIEATCVQALGPYLAAGQGTVGIHVDVSHSAATPIAATVTVVVELVAIEGRRLSFQVHCRDDWEAIGAGRHVRFIIDRGRFNAKLDRKVA